MRAAFVSLALLSACYSPGYRDCDVTCADSHACPTGFQCSASGFCVGELGTTCTGSDGGMDGGGDAPDAAMLGAWGTPRPVDFVSGTPTGIDDHPTLTDNMLLLYVHRATGTPAMHDVYGASRSSTTAPFPSPGQIDVSTSASIETTPDLSGNGLEIHFATNRSGGTTLDIFRTTRPSLTVAFGPPVAVAELNSATDDTSPAVSRDGMTIVFASSRSGIIDLYIANRMSLTQAWSAPQPMTMLNDPAYREDAPFLSTDKLTIYFTSNRGNDNNLYQATRANVADPFGPPQPIMELNTMNGYDGDPWVSPDGKTIYFTRVIGGVLTLMYATR